MKIPHFTGMCPFVRLIDPMEGHMSRYIQQAVEKKPVKEQKAERPAKPKPGSYTSEHLSNLGGKHGSIQWTK